MRMLSSRYLAVTLFLLCCSLTWFGTASSRPAAIEKHAMQEFYCHHDHVIGTSLDLWLTAADAAVADKAEQVVLDEIERLRRIFSTYDDGSEISRLNRTLEPMKVSAEMIDVLRQYETWLERSHGAFSGQLGELVKVWQAAEKSQREPEAAALSQIVHQIRRPGWTIDDVNKTVTRLTDQPLNLNSVAKGFIIGKAGELARGKVPALAGILLNLGGDMYLWGQDQAGRRGFDLGVQDPHRPEDNAPILARLRLQDAAIATSGGYQRFYTIQGQRHSHIFDPRTGKSATGPASATVIARDNVTANALATTLCVLSPEEGLKLAADTPGTECLLVTADGQQLRSPGFARFELPLVASLDKGDKKEEKPAKKEPQAWPDGFHVNLTVTLPSISSSRYRRPYVAIWVENADAKPVRTITVWGTNSRYWKDLPQWWKFARNDNALVTSVTRATRSPGKYQLVWDGKNDKGAALPQGTYAIFVEVHREHGRLTRQTGKLVCGPDSANLTLDANAETGATIIEYAKKKQP